MAEYLDNLARMLEIWNTSEPAKKRQLAEQAFEHNLHFVDPNHNIIGREAFLRMVDRCSPRFPALCMDVPATSICKTTIAAIIGRSIRMTN